MNNEGSFHKDELRDLKFDYIIANPPFNTSDWGGERLRDDVRWKYGIPPASNANYGWLQHIVHHLAPNGVAGVVLANGSTTSNKVGEDLIRKNLVLDDLVDCMVLLPGQIFYSTPSPACLWILNRNKGATKNSRDRKRNVLFINARRIGTSIGKNIEFSDTDIKLITSTYAAWKATDFSKAYKNISGFCYSATIEEIERQSFCLNPTRYTGSIDIEDEDDEFDVVMSHLTKKLSTTYKASSQLDEQIKNIFSKYGYEIS